MIFVLIAALAIVAWKSFIQLPPTGSGSWSNSAKAYADDNSTPVTRFDFGGVEANGIHFAGYLIQIENPNFVSPPTWFKIENGCLYVDETRVLPSQKFQLFVSENGNTPKRILLEPDDALRFRQLPARYENWKSFWSSLH